MELWNRIKANDVKGLELAFNKFYGPLCLYAHQIVNDEGAAQEIVSDLFLKLWNKREYILIKQCLQSYLYRSIHNSCLDYLKSAQTVERNRWIEITEQITTIIGDDEAYILDLLSISTIENDISNAIEQLPPQCKEIFRLSRFEQYTYTEIAIRMNLSVNTVKTQICRALDFLREHLKYYLPLILLVTNWFIHFRG